MINLLNAELNPICHLLALLGAHLIHHVSRIRVNVTELKLLSEECVPCFVFILLFFHCLADWDTRILYTKINSNRT